MRINLNATIRILLGFVATTIFLLSGCTGSKQGARLHTERPLQTDGESGVYHEVVAGDTLWAVSKKYGVAVDELIEVNALDDVQGLMIGQLLYVPVPMSAASPKSKQVNAYNPAASPSAEIKSNENETAEKLASVGGAYMGWPLRDAGIIFRSFKAGTEVPYEGISLGAPEGTPILAVLDGEVKYVGEEPNAFGKLILLTHAQGFITVYAHM